jgi:hypothetical protein
MLKNFIIMMKFGGARSGMLNPDNPLGEVGRIKTVRGDASSSSDRTTQY